MFNPFLNDDLFSDSFYIPPMWSKKEEAEQDVSWAQDRIDCATSRLAEASNDEAADIKAELTRYEQELADAEARLQEAEAEELYWDGDDE